MVYLSEYGLYKHLEDRGLDLSLHRVFLSDDEGAVATFPLYNLTGNLVGLQQYRPFASKEPNNKWYGRYFTRVHYGNVAAWGMESWSLSNTLFICEGLFDAAKITGLGFSALSVFSNDLSDAMKNWLWTVRKYRKVVALCDSDQVGLKLSKYAHEYYQVSKEYHDVGGMPLELVYDVCSKHK